MAMIRFGVAARLGMVKAIEAEFLEWEADVTAGVKWVKK